MITSYAAVEVEAVVLVLFQRRGVEDAKNSFADFDGFDVVAGFSGGAPVEGVDVLQNGEHGFCGKPLPEQGGQVLGREMRLAEENQNERAGMAAAKFRNLVGGVPVARPDFTHIFARHAIEPVDRGAVVPGSRKQFVKWSPLVSPVEFKAYALAQLVLVNFAAQPFFENVLIAGENSFHSQHDGALVQFGFTEQRRQVALRVGQGVVVADQNDSSFGDFVAHIARGQNSLVGAVGLAKVAKILASGGGIDGANLTLDAGAGVELGGTATRSSNSRRCHRISWV